MKIRHDAAFLSSLLFTIVFLRLIPLELAILTRPYKHEAMCEAMWMGISILTSEFGLSSLVIILIGLIVVWTGYLKKQRSAWFVMLVIVFGWAFPIFIWHDTLFEGRAFFFMHGSDWLSLFADAKRGSGFSSGVAQAGMIKGMLVFLPVVVALFLPVKSFFRPAPQRI